MDGPKIIGEFISKATFATDVYSVMMTSFVFIFHIQFVGTIIFLKEKFMAGCPFGDQVFIAQVITEENTCQIDQKTWRMGSGPCGVKGGTRTLLCVRTWKTMLGA